MNKIKTICAAIAVAVLSSAAPAVAAEGGVNIGVVDMSRILQTANAAKGVMDELEGKRAEFQKQVVKEEDALRGVEKEILKERESLSKEDFEKKRKDFETKIVEGQKMVQEKRVMLDQAYNDSMSKLRAETARIVAEVAKEKGLSVVLTREAIMLAMPEMNITDEVLKRLNAEVKKIPVDWSAAKKAGKGAG